MTRARFICLTVAFSCAVALLFWVPWCFEYLRGWTAFPIGASVGGVIYGVGVAALYRAAVND